MLTVKADLSHADSRNTLFFSGPTGAASGRVEDDHAARFQSTLAVADADSRTANGRCQTLIGFPGVLQMSRT
jgi:hypothetical protein